MSQPLTRRYFRVRGLVQGVGFRWFVSENARELGLSGWVRNREDGDVEGEAEGPAASVDELLVRLASGPRSARVEGVDSRAKTPEGSGSFEIR